MSIEQSVQSLRRETSVLSGPARQNHHYQSLVVVGEEAVPVLLRELVRDPSWQLVSVLSEIVGEGSPSIQEDERGYIYRIVDKWHLWGIKKGYLP